MSKHPHLRLVVSKPDDWQPPRSKAVEVVQTQESTQDLLFTRMDLYAAYAGSAFLAALNIGLVCAIIHMIRTTL